MAPLALFFICLLAKPALANEPLRYQDGAPIVPVRLMERASKVIFSSTSRLRIKTRGKVNKSIAVPADTLMTITGEQLVPATMRYWVQLDSFQLANRRGLADARAMWRTRKYAPQVRLIGRTFGLGSASIDNRRQMLLLPAKSKADAEALRTRLFQTFGARSALFEELLRAGKGKLKLSDKNGQVIATSNIRLTVESDAPIEVQNVEYGVGYDFHNFQTRQYNGSIEVRVDQHGKLAVINHASIETILRGLVPAEIYASAPAEALKAQAVTARGEVLAKIGLKHLVDPYFLCSEQHCAVYKGLIGEAAATNRAVQETRGEVLLNHRGRLVDSVYSAVCGGHTENNEYVWTQPKNENLRGRLDVIGKPPASLRTSDIKAFLSAKPKFACQVSSFSKASKFRWRREFSQPEVDAICKDLNVGSVQAISVNARGVSGRVRALTISGDRGAAQIRGELNIRRRFKMLNSAMFVVNATKKPKSGRVWRFVGGGWGHGVGLCQIGAIGRAEAGHNYREILGHYFNGARVHKIF